MRLALDDSIGSAMAGSLVEEIPPRDRTLAIGMGA
jgi:hypothetical protein